MNRNNWYETGDQIRKMVQDAVESKDFTQLGDTISDVVNQTMDWYQKTNREAAERIRRNMQEKEVLHKERTSSNDTSSVKKREDYIKEKTRLKVPGEVSGKIMKWTGYSMSSMFGLSLAIVSVVGAATGISMILPSGVLGVLFGSSLALGLSGKSKVDFANRFRKYREVVGQRTFCKIEELASAIGKNCNYVKKDLKKMLQSGYFKEGYLDHQETLLITDKETYQQYLTTQTEYERREKIKKETSSESNQTENEKQNKNLTPEYRELLEAGWNYIHHVHQCNEKIPGEEMSEKLDRLELVITRIFREAEKNPDVISDLKKMMSYYLPTTRKLLDAYCELDGQPVSGQNIENTKREIEVALDTINEAFETLLDDLFEDTAWDISSDISVLQTMLRQEGLTGKDFTDIK